MSLPAIPWGAGGGVPERPARPPPGPQSVASGGPSPPGLCLVILGGGGSNWPPGILADPPTHPHQKIFPQEKNEILLPSAGHLEEGRGTTILELLRRENCISKLCPRPLGSHPTPNTQIV